jgi:hypothetical protein
MRMPVVKVKTMSRRIMMISTAQPTQAQVGSFPLSWTDRGKAPGAGIGSTAGTEDGGKYPGAWSAYGE